MICSKCKEHTTPFLDDLTYVEEGYYSVCCGEPIIGFDGHRMSDAELKRELEWLNFEPRD